MLWHELWHEYLEEASRLFFTEKNADAMINHLETLYQLIDQVCVNLPFLNLADVVFRGHKQLVRLPSYKFTAKTFVMLERLVFDSVDIVIPPKWTGPGKYTMGLVGVEYF
jgi:hypothetical protein